jgi:hypothetical protein
MRTSAWCDVVRQVKQGGVVDTVELHLDLVEVMMSRKLGVEEIPLLGKRRG